MLSRSEVFTSSRSVSFWLSVTLVAPFALLEWINNPPTEEGFPVVLFGFMTIHASLIGLLVAPALTRFRAQRSIGALTREHWVRIVLGGFLLYVFAVVIVDQLPCFMGVPNCD